MRIRATQTEGARVTGRRGRAWRGEGLKGVRSRGAEGRDHGRRQRGSGGQVMRARSAILRKLDFVPQVMRATGVLNQGDDQTRICQVHSTCSVESGLSETETGGRVARSKAKAETPARRRGGLDPGRGGGLGRRGRIQKLRSWEN